MAIGPVQARTVIAELPTAAPSPPPAFDPAVPVAVGVHLERSAASTKLSFDLSKPAQVKAYILENPDRIVVEASDINFQIPPDAGKPSGATAGLIRSFRFGHFAPGKSRVVIDLASPAKLTKLDVAPIADGDPSRLVIQLARCDRSGFHEAAVLSGTPPEAPAVVPLATQPEAIVDSRPVIVIDPGHGGIDPGANGIGGVVEKRIVFDFASALAERLKATGRYKIVMTRTADVFVSLGDRVKVARDAKASLFVSLHADTLTNAGEVAGATVYTVSDQASDAEAARVADTENRADEVAGLETAPDATDVSDILFDLTRRETRTFSHTFQRTLAGYWQKIAHLNKNPERSAGFKVLKAPDVPSVLLELGYLSNEKDVAALTSADWRDKATGSVAASIDTFFASRRPSQQAAGVDSAVQAGDPDKALIVVLQPHL